MAPMLRKQHRGLLLSECWVRVLRYADICESSSRKTLSSKQSDETDCEITAQWLLRTSFLPRSSKRLKGLWSILRNGSATVTPGCVREHRRTALGHPRTVLLAFGNSSSISSASQSLSMLPIEATLLATSFLTSLRKVVEIPNFRRTPTSGSGLEVAQPPSLAHLETWSRVAS